jgi:serine/threonine-protein kinase
MGEWYCYNPNNEPLGSGAMGTVYLGYNCNTGEKIAVKRVKDYYANNEMIRKRAMQEASQAYRHPNLVEMIGYCEYAPGAGPIFILSKFVSGMQISEYVRKYQYLGENPDRVEKMCYIIYQVLDALDYIHFRGVIHRDIKPSNIMIEEESNIRLMDLGISQISEGNTFSLSGFIGTPQYSAPEQILRDKNTDTKINASTDIYELGVTFYELLTGVNPFDTPTEVGTLTKQLKEPLPASDKIPGRLMRVIWKATEKEQSRRFQTAVEFKAAIEAAMQPETSVVSKIQDRIKKYPEVCLCCLFIIIITIICVLIFI